MKEDDAIKSVIIKVYDKKSGFKETINSLEEYSKLIKNLFKDEKERRTLQVSIKINGGYGKNKETGRTVIINSPGGRFYFSHILTPYVMVGE